MIVDDKLNLWRANWQDETELARSGSRMNSSQLPRYVRRASMQMRLMLAIKLVLTVLFLVVVVSLAVRKPDMYNIGLAAGVIVLFCAGWIIAVDTWRGMWSPDSENTEAFLEISIQRCQASLRLQSAGIVFAGCDLAFIAAWEWWRADGHGPLSPAAFFVSPAMLGIGIAAIVVFFLLSQYRRKKMRELDSLLRLREQCRRADEMIL
jgi:hypothetical protein